METPALVDFPRLPRILNLWMHQLALSAITKMSDIGALSGALSGAVYKFVNFHHLLGFISDVPKYCHRLYVG